MLLNSQTVQLTDILVSCGILLALTLVVGAVAWAVGLLDCPRCRQRILPWRHYCSADEQSENRIEQRSRS